MVDRQPQAPQQPKLVRDAIAAHEARLLGAEVEGRQVLPALVEKIIGRTPDLVTLVPWCSDPVAVVNGVVFRGDAENPYDLKGGWLVVATQNPRTRTVGWRQVNSFEHLGEIAKQEMLKFWGPAAGVQS